MQQMTKLFVAMLAIVTISAWPVPLEAKKKAKVLELADLYQRSLPAVVFIEVAGPGLSGSGSGVVLHKDGFVATAAHVVEKATEILVEFQDGSKQAAKVASLSRTEDLALLKVAALPKGIAVPMLGDSDALNVGEAIYCIGAPLGLKNTLTTGIISAIRKDHGSDLAMHPHNVIQTDAAINQGNSGGALFNDKGEVIGIASFFASQTGGSVGLGFAVPSNTVRNRLFEHAIPYFGLVLRRVPSPLAKLLHWPVHKALLIESVHPSSAAARAGLRGGFIPSDFSGIEVMMGGDLIVGVGELEIGQAAEIHAYLANLKSGDKVTYTVIREGQVVQTTVTMDEIIASPKLRPLKKKGR